MRIQIHPEVPIIKLQSRNSGVDYKKSIKQHITVSAEDNNVN